MPCQRGILAQNDLHMAQLILEKTKGVNVDFEEPLKAKLTISENKLHWLHKLSQPSSNSTTIAVHTMRLLRLSMNHHNIGDVYEEVDIKLDN